jgi:hypothetical protein
MVLVSIYSLWSLTLMEGAREHGAEEDLWIERNKLVEAGHKVSYLLKYMSFQLLLICSNRGRSDDLSM